MKVEKVCTFNWEGAFRGMRNPMNSWDKSDSVFLNNVLNIGSNDMALAQKLIKAGPEHAKFLRQILVSFDVTAPMYFFSEFDTYKVGTVANSTSKMHKLASTPITMDCFETDDLNQEVLWTNLPQGTDAAISLSVNMAIKQCINALEFLREKYVETKDMKYWKELVRWLPESWLQTRTISCNYANIRNMYFQRKNHKLTEWHTFLDSLLAQLPYSEELIKLT